MSESQLSQFVERLNSDEELRAQVAELEKEAAARTRQVKYDIDAISQQNMEALTRLASEAGFDLSLDEMRPEKFTAPSDQELEAVGCWLTCCWVATSVWDGEGIPTVDGPGCGPGTTSFCI